MNIAPEKIDEVKREVLMRHGYSPTDEQVEAAIREYYETDIDDNRISTWTQIRDKHCKKSYFF